MAENHKKEYQISEDVKNALLSYIDGSRSARTIQLMLALINAKEINPTEPQGENTNDSNSP